MDLLIVEQKASILHLTITKGKPRHKGGTNIMKKKKLNFLVVA
jgi:hypothetical protein